ncbi:MAG: M20/M25/M40 family metallo-hydrolase [Syntrophomonadaceae bacterium]|jgi:tripeptide aminopeptidase
MINRDRLINRFIKLVENGSESGWEGSLRDMLVAEWEAWGLSVYEDDACEVLGGESGNLLINIPGTIDAPPLLLAAHMDTVVPGEGIKAIIGDDGIIRSDGSTILGSDDKAGIAAIMEAYEVIRENNLKHPPLEILFTIGEEQGLLGIKHFDFSRLKAPMGYVLDAGSAPGTVVVGSPCQNEIEYIAHGRAAHAGINPEDGLNAIQMAAIALSKMPCGRIDEETTCNIGTIQGGQARNIVAPTCRIKGEARSLRREKLDKLTEDLARTFKNEVECLGGQAEINITFLYPEVSLSADEDVVTLVTRAIANIGLEARMVTTGGGSDACIIHNNGIRCANLGVGMSNCHTTQEYIKISDLVDDARLVLAIIQEASHAR